VAEVRLQKFIAECGVASRRKAEELIAAGKVMVNGQVVKELGKKIDPARDRVQVRGKPLHLPERGVLLLHKPRHVVATMSDPEGRPTVADFLTHKYKSYFPVGRLDFESTGLLVMTNDGELAERLLHPRYGFERVYHVKVRGSVAEKTTRRLEKGVTLEDGPVSAVVKILETLDNSTWLEVKVAEGRNRVVRRMMDAVRHPVVKLQRVSYGPFRLGRLGPGEIRKLTDKEYQGARDAVLKGGVAGQGADTRQEKRKVDRVVHDRTGRPRRIRRPRASTRRRG